MEGMDYTRPMLYWWECRGLQYYAGQIGTASRHETRLCERMESSASGRPGGSTAYDRYSIDVDRSNGSDVG